MNLALLSDYSLDYLIKVIEAKLPIHVTQSGVADPVGAHPDPGPNPEKNTGSRSARHSD